MRDVVLSVYVINAFTALVLFMLSFRRARDVSGVMRFLICLAVPPAGCLWMLFLRCAPESKVEENDKKIRRPANMELNDGHENRMVPMSEALIMNDHLICCSMLIDALKSDPMKYASSIRKALEIGDSETAHYAAAAVMQMRHILMEKVNQLEAQYLLGISETELLEDYASILGTCLDSKLLDEATETRMRRSLEGVLSRQLPLRPTPEAFAQMISLLMDRNDFKDALDYSTEFLERYPDDERAYLQYIECMIHQNDNQGLRNFLSALPHFPVKLTLTTLQHVRCFISAGFATKSMEA